MFHVSFFHFFFDCSNVHHHDGFLFQNEPIQNTEFKEILLLGYLTHREQIYGKKDIHISHKSKYTCIADNFRETKRKIEKTTNRVTDSCSHWKKIPLL